MQATGIGQHEHVFLGERHDRHATRTMIVVAITAAAMVIEIVAGFFYGSMALTADGFHMSTHAGALLVAALAYRYARRHQHDPAFSFGTGKVGDLAGFASAIVLGGVALLIAADSLHRIALPTPIRFDEAIIVAVFGLAVNLVSAALLHDGGHEHPGHHRDVAGDHDHDEDHHGHGGASHAAHTHDHHHDHRRDHDHNFRAAYVHVAADALTSILAIGALLGGRFFGWTFLDPLAGLLGAVMIALWSVRLVRDSSAVLLDRVADAELASAIRSRLERNGARVLDLHLWRVGPGHNAAVISVGAPEGATAERYRAILSGLHGLSHVTIEVNQGSGLTRGPLPDPVRG